MDAHSEDDMLHLLEKRQTITDGLLESPYDLIAYIERAVVHASLGYPDLAAGDGYRALLLCDEVVNEGFEYHDEAFETLRGRAEGGIPAALGKEGKSKEDLSGGVEKLSIEEEDEERLLEIARIASIQCYRILATNLLLCGCLKSAYGFCTRGLKAVEGDEELCQTKEYIEKAAKRRLKVEELDIIDLPDQGLARRELYPWNDHEPDRFSQETLDFLNQELSTAAPNLEVKITELPTLLETASSKDGSGIIPTNKQLGLFAKRDIKPGEIVLEELSLLAANNRLKESLCDACSSELPPLTNDSPIVGCPDCDDIMFCNTSCLSRAQTSYHPAVCDKDIDTIAKDPSPKEKPFGLYLLLLSRALAMSATQDLHPLDLKEVKYIWGDFLPSSTNSTNPIPQDSNPLEPPQPPIWTLPFSFQYNVLNPLHVLEKMDIDIFTTLPSYDLWVLNTLYAKFRGTASGRVNSVNGHPEVAAVHPLWCLANHDCDPNVSWEWGSEMKLWAKGERVGAGKAAGLRGGEEVLSHYCDIGLSVGERREWAKGSLGGWCMCERCKREAAEEEALSSTLNGDDSTA